MGIVIGIDARLVEFPGPEIVIGRSPTAQLSLPQDSRLAERHAVMRLVAGRWLIEAQGDAALRVGDGRPTKVAWLNPGDSIDLTETGPRLTFSPPQPALAPSAPIVAPTPAPVITLPGPPQPSRGAKTLVAALSGSILVLAAVVLLVSSRGGRTDSVGSGDRKPDDTPTKVTPPAPPAIDPASNATAAPASLESAVYLVLLEDPKSNRLSRHGMACAISPRELVTSAYSVGLSIIRGRETSPVAKVQGLDPESTARITDIRLFPKFDELVYQLEELQQEIQKLVKQAEDVEQSDDADRKKSLPEIHAQIRQADETLQKIVPLLSGRDLAVLVVDRDLPAWLPTAAGDASIGPGLTVDLVGFPWSLKQTLFHPDDKLRPSSVTAQLSSKQEIEKVKPYYWLVRFGDITRLAGRDQPADIWSGSPVVDGSRRLVGVYSRTHPTRNQDGFDLEWHEVTSIDSLGEIKD